MMRNMLSLLQKKSRRKTLIFWTLVILTGITILFHYDTADVWLKTARRSEVTEMSTLQCKETTDNNSEVEIVHEPLSTMIDYVNNVCRGLTQNETDDGTKKDMYRKMRSIPAKRFLYCPVEKVGSTFWWRVMYILEMPSKGYKHPFEVPIPAVLTLKHIGYDPRKNYDDSFRFMFVRNPYGRILSLFVDKLLVPNPIWWNNIGKRVIQMFRKNATEESLKCGHDPSFLEFVQYIIWSLNTRSKIDIHFRTASEMCMPCHMNYTFIGKMESAKNDFSYVLRQIGLNSSLEAMADRFSDLTAEDAIVDSITAPFGWRKNIIKCMNWNEALMRVWRKLQIRGLIGMDHPYPLNESSAQNITAVEYIKVAKQAKESSSLTDLKRQKNKIYEETYKMIPLDIMEKFRDVYHLDFTIFGYDDRPEILFEGRQDETVTILNDYLNFRNNYTTF